MFLMWRDIRWANIRRFAQLELFRLPIRRACCAFVAMQCKKRFPSAKAQWPPLSGLSTAMLKLFAAKPKHQAQFRLPMIMAVDSWLFRAARQLLNLLQN